MDNMFFEPSDLELIIRALRQYRSFVYKSDRERLTVLAYKFEKLL